MSEERYYGVQVGRKPGIYSTWDECLEQITKYPKARYQRFNTRKGAQDFIENKEERKKSKNKYQKKRERKIREREMALSIIKDKITNSDRIVVWTDGSCKHNGTRKARAGIGVYWNSDIYKNLSERLPGELQSNNRSEIYAVIRALETCQDQEKTLDIVTDSEYVINAHQTWIPRWIENGWQKKTGPVKNRDLLEQMEHLIKMRGNVIFTHVPSHSNIPENEKADQLARDAIK
jgi:ribonuclease HI